MTTQVTLTPRDLRSFRSFDQERTVTALRVDEAKSVRPNDAIMINMNGTHLGYEPVKNVADAARRTIKRLAKRQRFWSRAGLQEAVVEIVGVPPEQSAKAVKGQVAKAINQMLTDGELLIVG